jgi:hypothetical protein
MSFSLPQLSVATPQSQVQLMLEFPQMCDLAPDIHELSVQPAAHRSAGVHTIAAQSQETANFPELESQTLHAAYEGQRLEVGIPVLSKAAGGSQRGWQQGAALVKANCVGSESGHFRHRANPHLLAFLSEMYTLEYSPESRSNFGSFHHDCQSHAVAPSYSRTCLLEGDNAFASRHPAARSQASQGTFPWACFVLRARPGRDKAKKKRRSTD